MASSGGAPSRSVVPLDPVGLAFILSMERPAKLIGWSFMCEGVNALLSQVCDPLPGIILKHRDKAAPLAIEGVADCEFFVAAVTVCEKVLGL